MIETAAKHDSLDSNNEEKGNTMVTQIQAGTFGRTRKGRRNKAGRWACELCPALDLKMLAHPGLLLAK